MKQLTKGQMAVLATYEDNLRTAVSANYVRAMRKTDVAILEDMHNDYTGGSRHFNANCQACVLELCKDLGRLYFAQRDAQARADAEEERRARAEAAKAGEDEVQAIASAIEGETKAVTPRSLKMNKSKGGKK